MRASTRTTLLMVLSVAATGAGLGGLAALELQRLAPPPPLSVDSQPLGHVLVDLERVALRHPMVLVDGVERTFKDLLMGLAVDVPMGTHRVAVVDGTLRQQWRVTLTADDPHAHVAFTAHDAEVRIGTLPRGALLEVDGRDIMLATPVPVEAPLSLAQGYHRMVFTHGGTRYPYDVVVPAGDSTLMILQLGRNAVTGNAVFSVDGR